MSTIPSNTKPGRQINWVKLSVRCTVVGLGLLAGIAMLTLILTPIVFRSLLPEQQARLTRRFPFMAAFEPTHPFKYLPTLVVTNDRGQALLSTPTGLSWAVTVRPSDLSAGQDYTLNDSAPATIPTSGVRASATPVVGPLANSPTPPRTLAVTPTLEPTALPAPTLVPVPSSFHIARYRLVPQDWNACGPANLTQALNYYGWTGDQREAESYLKPDREDKNVSPWQMVTFVNENTGLRALWRVAGDISLIRRLVAQQFAVILEAGYEVPDQGWMGHFMTITGYDDSTETMTWLDTNAKDPNTAGVREKYADIDKRWEQFNRMFIVVYQKERTSDLAALLGSDADGHYNALHALGMARESASKYPNNPFVWFNLGSSYVLLGQYQNAADAFDQVQQIGRLPFRMLWYQFTPYEAYYNVGNYRNVLALVNATLQTTPYVEETFYWRGMAEAALGKTDQAVADFQRVLAFNPNFSLAADKLTQVKNGNFRPPVVAQVQ